MLDPVSGTHMAARIRERLPQAPFTALEDTNSLSLIVTARTLTKGNYGSSMLDAEES